MKRRLKFLSLILLFSVMITSLQPSARANSGAADITGAWNFEVEFDGGRKGTPTFTFKQEGDKLSGAYKGGLGEASVSGTVKGDDVAFTFKAKAKAMDDEEITVTFTGKIESADGMKGTVKASGLLPPGKWTARRQAQ